MSSYTILHVDDDEEDLMLIAEAFEKHTDQLRVIHANNGVEALQILEDRKRAGSLPCLILLDINMPVMDGKETLKQIKSQQEFTEVPVVLFSTSTNPADKLFATSYGADFITKPVNYTDVEGIVQQFAKRCQMAAAS